LLKKLVKLLKKLRLIKRQPGWKKLKKKNKRRSRLDWGKLKKS